MRLSSLSLPAVIVLSAVAAHAQMMLPGKFEVTDTGSASYTIPISVVPGTAGLEPKLSLHYDSRGGNGLLGVGWSLAGLPAITRCGRTIVQDGAVGGINYDANDRFCLDGQRLIAISGAYGADQTEYRTERESFSKVVSYGSAGSGPAWFKVWTKAGLVMEFGNTADSRIEAQGKVSARVWAINQTSDTKGNWFSVSYTEDNANGEYRPARIDYTGNGATAPANSVRFVYETRPDIVPLYQAGSLIKTTQRMTKVQAWQGENLVRDCQVVYEQSVSTQRSRVASLSLCVASQCLPNVNFSWKNTTLSLPQPQRWSNAFDYAPQAGGWTDENTWPRRFSDLNADGKPDIVGFNSDGPHVGLSDGASFMSPAHWLGQFGSNPNAGYWNNEMVYPRHLADVNGDGIPDIVGFFYDGVHVSLGTGGGFGAPSLWIAAFGASPSQGTWNSETTHRRFLLDMNGDARADIVGFGTEGVYVSLSTGTGFAAPQLWINYFGAAVAAGQWTNESYWPRHLADVNGDGLPDVIGFNSDGPYVAISTGNGFLPRIRWIDQFGAAAEAGGWYGGVYTRHMVDANGDGMADILGFYTNGVYVSLSDGTKFLPPSYWTDHFGAAVAAGQWTNDNVWPRRIADMNGDGLPDIIGFNSDGLYVALSSGSGFLPRTRWLNHFGAAVEAGQYNNEAHWTRFLMDLNGDGLPDALGYSGLGPTVSAALNTLPDLLAAVTSGSATTQMAYTPLSVTAAPYTKDFAASACAYPCLDLQGPLYVVSEVKSSNGLGITGAGGEYRSSYRYVGAKADSHGRGFLGFRQMTVRDEQTGVEQVTSYRQDYPFTGLVASREKKLGAQLLNRSTNSYSSTDLGGTRRYPFLTQSLEESWELSGQALPAVTTSYQYDAFGNATQVGVSTGDGHTKVTANTYSNDATNWLLGRLIRSEVTSTTPVN